MQVIEDNNKLFSSISNEEAADINGGSLASAANYNTVATAFGVESPDLVNTTLLFTVDALKPGKSGQGESGQSGQSGQGQSGKL